MNLELRIQRLEQVRKVLLNKRRRPFVCWAEVKLNGRIFEGPDYPIPLNNGDDYLTWRNRRDNHWEFFVLYELDQQLEKCYHKRETREAKNAAQG